MPVSKRNQNLPKLWQSIKPQQSVRQFENTIIQFHSAHRTSIRQLPYVLGKKINLRKLYISVIKRGGYKKVNENNEWEDVLGDLNLPKEITNCELAIQSIYHRYLEEYEREQWNALSSGVYAESYSNNNNDTNSTDINLSKHSSFISELAVRDKSFMAAFVNDNTPKVYCDYQHIIQSSMRSEAGLSCDFKDQNEFNHLKMSLLSGLTNEIEFALNTLLIMSNSSQIRLDLRFTGNLLDLILASVGILEQVPCSYYEQFKNCSWMKDCLQFWNATVVDGVGRIFLIPNIFTINKSEVKNLMTSNISNVNSNYLFNNDNHIHQITDPCAQRIHLVATVLYNLTNDSTSNSRSIIHNFQFLRFLFLSVHSIDPVLRRLCLQTLSKLRFVLYPIINPFNLTSICDTKENSVDLDSATQDDDDSENEWFSNFLLDFVQTLLISENRFDRITALELVQTLCLIEENHQILNQSFHMTFVSSISSQLLVPDIHPLCCALESLVSLSQLGEDMCRRMAMCHALLKILLQFIQIEAQMFGPSAVYKIKTFNHRPPIPMPSYNTLPQIMRYPSGNSLRPNFVNPLSHAAIGNLVDPNIQIQCPGNIPLPISAANYNSISTHGLSKLPFQNLSKPPQMFSQHSPNYNPSHLPNNSSCKSSQLTPLQQIDQLLTKSIASFGSSSCKKDETIEPEKTQITESQIEKELEKTQNSPEPREKEGKKIFKNTDEKVPIEKKIVKIKCCDDDIPDYEIGEINGSKICEREKNGIISESKSAFQTENLSSKMVNGDDINGIQSPENNSESDSTGNSLGKTQTYLNGTLDIDASNVDDPDRRQMPPPSLPTPSMLKKQMRPKLSPPSQVGVANGYLQQLNSKVKRKLVSEMTLTTNAQIEDRCDRAKSWLRQHYRLSNDSKLFVLKQDLVNQLHEFLFEDDNEDSHGQGSRRFFSAHELHSCIKDVFGSKVQVKVEHRHNGNSQLIYSNLCRIHEVSQENKNISNGIINSIIEMNGFVHHPAGKKRPKLNHKANENNSQHKEDNMKRKKTTVANSNYINRKQLQLTIRRIRKRALQPNKRINKIISEARHKLSIARRTNLKAYLINQKKCDNIPQNIENYANINPSLTSNVSAIESHLFSYQNDKAANEIYLPFNCLWGSCTERFSDDNSLNFHLTNDHIPQSTNNLSPSRTNCQWQHCITAAVLRAPLSLLSHVIQEHLTKSNPSFIQSPNMTNRIPNTVSYSMPPSPSINSVAINSQLTPNPFSQISEKSGWSVLYDHFRLEEQMQPHLPEGPITKHIRISASIILRNMSRHSIVAKEFLRNNESLLSTVAMSNQDCAPIIIQCLDELALPTINDS